MRRTFAALVAGALVAVACGSPAASPAPPVSAQPPPTSALTPTAGPTESLATASPSPVTAGPWFDAGTMSLGRLTPHAVLLGDGSVLVVGNDELGCVRPDSAATETWSQGANAWSAAASLPKGRAELAATALLDGRALVTGGVNPGNVGTVGGAGHQAYSSTYVYDALAAPASWSKTGQLGTARTAPAAATLLDGRVLVLGGYYLGGSEGSLPAITLASYRSSSEGPGGGAELDDVEPPGLVPALATAELYDPVAGTWSPTGSLRFARLDPAAVTLADGRVLVVGSRKGGSEWNYTRPIIRDGAFVSAEIYDPATGRFSMVSDLPATDWSPIADLHPAEGNSMWTVDPGRTLVALADGGALLFDKAAEWNGDGNTEGRIVRTLRFDPVAGSWTVIDVRVWQHDATGDPDPMVEVVAGRSRSEPLVARLADGRVLVAGGIDGATVEPSTEADLYDPVANTWTTLPPMPEPRSGGAAVTLPDGSMLLVGGDGTFDACSLEAADCECGQGTTGLASAVRFMPGP